MKKIVVEMPPASKDEKAWIAGQDMIIDYHKWDKDIYDYIDATVRILVSQVVEVGMIFGPNGGFHRMELVYGTEFEVLTLSKNHQEVIMQIYNLAKAHNMKIKKYTLERGGEK